METQQSDTESAMANSNRFVELALIGLLGILTIGALIIILFDLQGWF